MTNEWRIAAQGLTDFERQSALKAVLENAKEPEAGVIRQLLGPEKRPLSEKQQHVYQNHIEELLVERCGRQGCGKFVPAGTDYCQTCQIEFG